jgi:hypothetical protein
MLSAAAEIFFQDFPAAPLEAEVNWLLNTLYRDAGARRNEIAHGVVTGAPLSLERQGYHGYFLGPTIWNTNKRGSRYEPEFLHTSRTIREIARQFTFIRMQAFHLCTELETHWKASPEKSRLRY